METTLAVLGDGRRSVTEMRQFSIRTLLLCTTLIAFALGLVAYDRMCHSQAQRLRIEEQQLIAKIDSSLGPAGIYVAEPGVTLSGDGSVVYLMPTGPKHPSLCSSDAYNRATIIYLEGKIQADTIRQLNDLQHLRTVGLAVDSDRNGDLPNGFDDLLFATVDFHEQHPDVSLSLTCSNWSGDVVFDYP